MIEEIQIVQVKKWNDIVRSFENYEVFYLNEYAMAFMKENKKNGVPILLVYKQGNDKAINVVFKRDIGEDEKLSGKIPVNTYYDLITPYGYGGFKGNISNYKNLNKEYNDYCQEKRYICEFIRFELFGDYYKFYDGRIETRMHNVVRNLLIPIDEMWMDFKQKVRKNVKRANKNNLKVIMENTEEHLTDFLDVYFSTMERNDAKSEYYFSENFFKILNQMKDNIMYFYVVKDNKIISSELVIYGSENSYSYLGGTNRDYYEYRPNDLLKYTIIKWAKEKGLKNFVLGGGCGSDDGIFQYKTCLAPNGIVDFYIGKKIFDQVNYEKIVGIRAIDNPECRRLNYFPEYRA